MPHPWVYNATVAADGSKITFSVEVTDITIPQGNTQGTIEITGEATQINGALARISCITDRSTAYKGAPDPTDQPPTDRYFVDVDAVPTPGHPFLSNLDITVFVRVSKVWVTVLGASGWPERVQGTAAPAGTTWAYETDAQIGATGSY